MLTKVERDNKIMDCLKRFKICSRNQLCELVFKGNSNPITTCNRVMKRLVTDGIVCSFPRTKDQCYLYALKGFNPKNQKVDHQLKIVDTYIHLGCPKDCLIEPEFGSYEPDLFYKDHFNRSVCVEVQLTKISQKRMQEKINNFMKEEGKNHDSRLLLIYSNHKYSGITFDSKKYKIKFEPIPHEKTL